MIASSYKDLPCVLCACALQGTLRNTNNAIFLAALMGKNGATAASRQQHACWARRWAGVLQQVHPLLRLHLVWCCSRASDAAATTPHVAMRGSCKASTVFVTHIVVRSTIKANTHT
jgi:hypothetical protein